VLTGEVGDAAGWGVAAGLMMLGGKSSKPQKQG
jgi:hypothetical protein